MKTWRFLLLLLVAVALQATAAEPVLSYTVFDRFEYRESESATLVDAQGWVGRDLNKFWWKAEGEFGDIDEFDIQALYSRAVTPYFDLQAGIALQSFDSENLAAAVLGWQGLAPQWFEIDAQLAVREDGDVALQLEAEYDLLLTQRLVLQPRFEIGAGSKSNDVFLQGSGLRATELGLRLRYELRREIAPYIGISWVRFFGNTADRRVAADFDDAETTAVIGLRAWF